MGQLREELSLSGSYRKRISNSPSYRILLTTAAQLHCSSVGKMAADPKEGLDSSSSSTEPFVMVVAMVTPAEASLCLICKLDRIKFSQTNEEVCCVEVRHT